MVRATPSASSQQIDSGSLELLHFLRQLARAISCAGLSGHWNGEDLRPVPIEAIRASG